jgi:2-polyprenyl-3-methyl-5-hydroxy-6-metoxy-1,4-benzoquinol methylase
MSEPAGAPTQEAAYAQRLQRIGGVWWKRVLNVQAPYRAHLRRLRLGRVLDIGCGIGRNLSHLDGNGVGVDHNVDAVAAVRALGFEAYVPAEFHRRKAGDRFDSLLVSHVLEHLPAEAASGLLAEYLPYIKPGGRVVFITPQERGYASDATHVWFVGHAETKRLAKQAGLTVERQYSFPFPRRVGRIFAYNEFVMVGRVPDTH